MTIGEPKHVTLAHQYVSPVVSRFRMLQKQMKSYKHQVLKSYSRSVPIIILLDVQTLIEFGTRKNCQSIGRDQLLCLFIIKAINVIAVDLLGTMSVDFDVTN
jgi:hypothetical protein